MFIKLINHASVLIGNQNFSLLTDPWYSGSIFNNGWKLIHEDENQKIDNYNFEYLWISHEHPDHLSINEIKQISSNKKKKFKILFQNTKDKKVINFFKKQNIETKELDSFQTITLKNNIKLTCSSVGNFDSWLMIEIDNKKILNLNDCNVSDQELVKIKKKWNSIDVLLSQFSFASWICNPNDDLMANKQIERIKKRVDKQIDILKPLELIPFASFFYLCHEENSYLNKYLINIQNFYQWFNSKIKVTVLFPEETYLLDDKHDNSKSLRKWKIAYDKISKKKLINKVATNDIAYILNVHKNYVNEIKKKNNLMLIKILSFFKILTPTKIYLKDINKTVSFSLKDDLKILKNDNFPDITMSSESFIYLLKYQWGRGTLFVNGRLECNYMKLNNFMSLTKIFYANNIGLYFPKTLKIKDIFKKNNFSKLIEEFCE